MKTLAILVFSLGVIDEMRKVEDPNSTDSTVTPSGPGTGRRPNNE